MAGFDALERALQGATEVVFDASVAIDVALGEASRRALALRFLEVCHHNDIRLITPPTYAGEVDTGVRQAMHRQGLDATGMMRAYQVLGALPVHLIWDEAEMRAVRLRARAIADELMQSGVDELM